MLFRLKQKNRPICSFILFFLFFIPAVVVKSAEGADALAAKPSHYLTATYFHGSVRCPTCQKIEALSSEAIQQNYASELKSGALIWRAVNIEEPDNRHFIKDYQLYTRSLIIVEVKDGKEIRWKNLEKIWNYVGDEGKFIDYVTSEINTWKVQ